MQIHLFNTLGKKLELFLPLNPPQVKMYNCGPTVYDDAHIGNLRSYVFADILKRVLEYAGYKVLQVINITDIGHLSSDADEGEDKMAKGIRREGLPFTLEAMRKLADKYAARFMGDLEALNCEPPYKTPKASENITEDIEFVKLLEEKGFAYAAPGGIYFDTGKIENYGKLGGQNPDDEARARIIKNEGKRGARDFALWKSAPAESPSFDSPWGKGFPGWHIECSVMAAKYLGKTIDIHTGGMDHISIHHNNEIVQSEAAYGMPLSRFWLHNAFLTLGGGKMAKSEGRFITLNELSKKGYEPFSLRYLFLSASYRSPIAWSDKAIFGAQSSLKKIREAIFSFSETTNGFVNSDYRLRFEEIAGNDLNTPQALALLWELLSDGKISSADKRATALDFDRVFGLKLGETKQEKIPEDIKKLVEERDLARKAKDWKKADGIRKKIEEAGFEARDSEKETKVKKKQ